ncbi:MAG TPA: GAF domain-containing SpoIIE family protein phosphatase [Gemmataceae bacterium]|jgi:serine phosphatase RsbU (regulator of sigma subunit)|nr:GAF domain-containing SpoIIE family protein phosphatase [Gemmataceae bacterium]
MTASTQVPTLQVAELTRQATEKWATRKQAGTDRLQAWLEAEVELLCKVADLDGRLTHAQEFIDRLLAKHTHDKRRLTAEHAVSRILGVSETFIDAAPKLAQAICENLDWDVGVIWRVDPDADLLRCVEVWHAPHVAFTTFERDARLRTFSRGMGLPGRVWAKNALVWMPDVTAEDNFQGTPSAGEEEVHGAIGFPVHNGTEFLGVLEFFSREVRQPDENLSEMMTSIGSNISQFIERRTAETELHTQESNHRIGREIQQGLLPKTMPRLPGFQISGRSLAADSVGGDCFDFIPMSIESRDCLGVVIADASGHGIGSALLVGQTRAYLSALALACSDVGLLLDLTNYRLAVDMPSDHFVTAFFMSLDPHTRSLIYAGAGHLPGYILDQRGQTREVLPSTGLPLGIDPASKFPASPAITLAPGELVLLITDGIVEAASSDGSLFGTDRTLAIVRRHQHQMPDEILTALFDAVGDFCEHKCHDDMTAVILKVEGDA